MSIINSRIGAALCFALLVSSASGWFVQNGDFSQGLQAWKAAWPVRVIGGEAVLDDAQSNHAYLFQAVATAGVYQVEFDYFNGLSADTPGGFLADSAYVSFYTVERLSDFILEHDRFASSTGLMDLDTASAFNLQGTISSVSVKGEGWGHFSGIVTNTQAHALLVFEVYDLNGLGGDSELKVDNVECNAYAQ